MRGQVNSVILPEISTLDWSSFVGGGQPDPVPITNDIGWKPVTFVYIHTGIIHFRELSCQYPRSAFSSLSGEERRRAPVAGLRLTTGDTVYQINRV